MSDSNNKADELYQQANAAKEAGDLEKAIELLNQILSEDENHLHSHMALAVYYQKVAKCPEAVQHARKVTELDPNDPFSWTQLSVICQRCGLIPEAEEAMDQSRRISGSRGHHSH